ncbi:MAG: potassium transporter TrkH [Myxococcales bacterium]|nr:potassium transporter TrkH [Myxococcales bacterium]
MTERRLGPVFALVSAGAATALPPVGPAWLHGLLVLGLLAGLAIPRWPRRARAVVTLAGCGWLVGRALVTPEAPSHGLALGLAGVAGLAVIWPPGGGRARRWVRFAPAAVGVLAVFEAVGGPAVPLTLTQGVGLAVALAAPLWWSERADDARLLGVAAALLPPALAVWGQPLTPGWAAACLAAPALAAPAIRRPREALAPLLDLLMAHPSRAMVVGFLALGALGTGLLRLPASARAAPIGWLDAAFTAVSASCVTGLAVLDTPVAFSGVGQVALLLLIQVGGLGIMVFSAAALALLGRRWSVRYERAAAELVGAEDRASLGATVRVVLWVTGLTEGLGALALWILFMWGGEPAGSAAWRALFTSISAFCNAGFALQSDSLVGYAGQPAVLAVIALIILVGGLGPLVVVGLRRRGRPGPRPLAHRLVLWTTAALLVGPALAIAAFEWSGTLAGMGPVDKIANAVFQSVTLRTAGFNSIDLAAVHPATWLLMVGVMFVGGSPGSTAGGMKTTTLAVLAVGLYAVVRGRPRPEVFGRTVPTDVVLRALAVAVVGLLTVAVTLFGILLTQPIPLDAAAFEVVSAVATVGLSTGGTAALDAVGKVLIIGAMFAGRVGPLTLFVFLASRPDGPPRRRYPEESVPVG